MMVKLALSYTSAYKADLFHINLRIKVVKILQAFMVLSEA
jgi:hypothetical protein